MQILDDGIGFDAASRGHGGQGLAGMQERAQRIDAKLSVESPNGKGTTVTVEAPLGSQVGRQVLEERG